MEKFREIVTLADGKSIPILSFFSYIIGEEISGYKTGGLLAEQTAEKIQNRIQLYLDEQKKWYAKQEKFIIFFYEEGGYTK